MSNRVVCPIFSVSNVTGEGIKILKQFISKLPFNEAAINGEDSEITGTDGQDQTPYSVIDSEFAIDSSYMVTNTGLVVGGTVTKGQIVTGQTLMLGPDKNGHFKPVIARSIQENRVDVQVISKGASTTIAIKNANKKDPPLKTSSLKKGMHLVGLNKNALNVA